MIRAATICILLFFAVSPVEGQKSIPHQLEQIVQKLKPLKIGRDRFFPRSIYKDSEGFIWIGLRNSVLRFDGIAFQEFAFHPVNNRGMLNAGPDIITEDHDGNIWIGSWYSGAAKFDRETQTFSRLKVIASDAMSLQTDPISDIFVDQAGDVWISTKDFVLHKYDKSNNAFHVYHCPMPSIATEHNISQTHFGQIAADPVRPDLLWIGSQFGLFTFSISTESFEYIGIDTIVDNRYEVLPSPMYLDEKGHLWFGHFNKEGLKVFDTKSRSWIRKYNVQSEFGLKDGSNRILQVYPYTDSLIIASTWWNHLFLINKYDLREYSIMPYYTERKNNLGMYADTSAELLIGLDSEILRYNSSSRFTFFSLNDFLNDKAKGNFQSDLLYDSVNHQYLISTRGGDGILKLSEGLDELDFVRYKSKEGFKYLDINFESMALWSDTVFIASEEGLLVLNPERNSIKPYQGNGQFPDDILTGSMLHVSVRDGDVLMSFKRGGLVQLSKAREHGDQAVLFSDLVIQKLIHLSDSSCAVATQYGLRIIDTETWQIIENYTDTSSLKRLMEFEVRDIELRNGHLWVGTRGNGLARLIPAENGKYVTRFFISNSDQGSNSINGVLITDDLQVWTSSDYGFSSIDVISGEFENYGLSDGVSFAPRGPWFHQLRSGQICASANGGFYFFKPYELRNSFVPVRPYLKSIEVLGEQLTTTKMSATDPLTFNADDDHISFYMGALNTNSEQPVNHYKYMLLGYDKEWIQSYDDPVARYTNLAGGAYEFQFTASPKGQRWSENSVSIPFTIEQTFMQSPLFKIIVTIALFIFGFIFWHSFQKRRKRRVEGLEMEAQLLYLEKEQVEFELKALRSQMNPHFLHNALNSINWYILNHRPSDASDYIVKFSRLIRRMLEYTKVESISLGDELQGLKLYIELEEMRFEDSFTWEIRTNDDLDVNAIRVPSMMIQPFVENAIWHGLLPKVGKKSLLIRIFSIGNALHIEVEDNGIGRAASALRRHRENDHVSRGIELIRKRIAYFNHDANHNPLSIIDLYENGQPAGTLIHIVITSRLLRKHQRNIKANS